MRVLPILLVLAAAMVAPSGALAAGSTSSADRYFVITGLVLGDQKIDAQGKLAIQGGQLMASAGCNSIGGQVTVDGDLVTISDPLVQTEMACPGVSGDTEAALIKILQDHGPFHITAGAWDGDGAQILVDELDNSGPARTLPPDGSVGSSPEPVIDPGMSCPPVQIDPGFTGGGSSGSSGSGGAATGSGSGTTPNAGGPTDGENPTSTAVAEPAGTAVPKPVEVPPATPMTGPAATDNPGVIDPAPPPPDATPGQEPGVAPSDAVVEPAPSEVVEPEPSAIVLPDPGVGVGVEPVPDPCLRFYANDLTGGSGAGAIPPEADAAAEHAKANGSTGLPVVLAWSSLALVLLAAIGVAAWDLRIRRRGSGADASR